MFAFFFQFRRDSLRSLLLLCAGVFGLLGSNALHVPGAGALACLTSSFVATLRWRRQHEDECRQRDSGSHEAEVIKPVSERGTVTCAFLLV